MSKPPSLRKTFLIFLAPLMLSNALQSLFGTVSNALLGQMIGVDALAAVSVFFPVMFFLFAFVMGLSTGATVLIGQAWGAGERDKVKAVAGATLAIAPGSRNHDGAIWRPVQPAIDDRARHAARYPRPGQRLCARHAADDAARLRLPADDRDAARRRRHADAADGVGLVDRDRPAPDAAPHPRLVRTSRHRRDGPGMGVGYCHRADAGRARPISASQEEPAGAGRRISARASARWRAAWENPGHRYPERGRDGGDGGRRTGAARPRQRLRF